MQKLLDKFLADFKGGARAKNAPDLGVTVVCKNAALRNRLFNDVREALEKSELLNRFHVQPVKELDVNSLESERERFATVVYCDDEYASAAGQAAVPENNPCRVVVVAYDDAAADRFPIASLMGDSPIFTSARHIGAALEKSYATGRLREKFTARILSDKKDLEDYFRLRYRVWRDLGYLAKSKKPVFADLEIDHTDRNSLPMGVFDDAGELIGCGRLVYSINSDMPDNLVNLIEKIAIETNDANVIQNFKRPMHMMLPYDVLESFPGFAQAFKEITIRHLSHAELSRIIVKDKCRKLGVGEAIVDTLIGLAQSRRVDVLFLACLERHRSFYERSGFRHFMELRCESFTDVDVPAIIMERRLPRT